MAGKHGTRPRSKIRPRAVLCERCGTEHLRCSGHAKVYDARGWQKDGSGVVVGIRPCTHWPMHGQSVCSTHGGAGRNREVGAQQWEKERKLAGEMERADRAVKTFGLPIITSPQKALLDEIARTAGHVEWLGNMVGNLDPDDVGWGLHSEEHTQGKGEMATDDTPDIDLTKTTKVARPAIWVELYHKERSHLVHVCKVAIQCGLAERQIKLAEEQGQMIAAALRQVFEDPELELTITQVQVARVVASRVLRTLSLGGARPAALKVLTDGESG